MSKIRISNGEQFPVEMHKVRIVQKLNLIPIEKRLKAIIDAGCNTFLLRNRDVFLDMLTDSGVNAMSDRQLSSMLLADDSYAGSETFYKLEDSIKYIFEKTFFLPAHQGRACEHIISKVFVKKGSIVPMNYHFTTTKAHITTLLGKVLEIPIPEAYDINSSHLFKGNMDAKKLREAFIEHKDNIPFVRMEAGTNLIGGQPFSLSNIKEIYSICRENNVPLVLDASLLSDNLYFIKKREKEYQNFSILDITREISKNTDIVYFSARKLSSARGGGICTNNESFYKTMRELVPLYEGFLTYGGMSVREMEAMAVGLIDTMDETVISQGPEFIEYMTAELLKNGVPCVTPAGGLGCHLDANRFVSHIKELEFRAASLAVAIYIVSGIRGMERGTLSEQRDENGNEVISDMELVRLAMPRRVFTMSQIKYAIDRITWLYENKELIGGIKWDEEPKTLRFFYGRLKPVNDWPNRLLEKFKKDFKDSL
ncbi:tryptophanase [Acholeplasma sp. OttesenSCG-928-E16]|nr:tryptophanase [Acholeplasma sp. OttesenSCG-928-E16]